MSRESNLDGVSGMVGVDEMEVRVSDDMNDLLNAQGLENASAAPKSELDCNAPEERGERNHARVFETQKSEEVGVIFNPIVGASGNKIDSRAFEMKSESLRTVQYGLQPSKPESEHGGLSEKSQVHSRIIECKVSVEEVLNNRKDIESPKSSILDYKSLLSEFDDYVASEKMSAGISRALNYGFEVGDMVWGKVKSHPWWPGHIYNEVFASTSVRRTRRTGYVLVAFFGDSSYGWFDPAELVPFEPYFEEKCAQTNGRTFVRAVEEALDEASRRSALGLICNCRNQYNFRPTSVPGYFAIDVPDYEPHGIYSAEQLTKARASFLPNETLSFLKQLALRPQDSDSDCIDHLKKKAAIFALRKAIFEEFDNTYAEAFQAKGSRSLIRTQERHPKEPPRAPLSGPLVIAETLGEGKSSKKPIRVKDSSKHDRYLIKKREEAADSSTMGFTQVKPTTSLTSGYSDENSEGNYILQRRESAVPGSLEDDKPRPLSRNDASANLDAYIEEVSKSCIPHGSQELDFKPSCKKEMSPVELGSVTIFSPSKPSGLNGVIPGSLSTQNEVLPPPSNPFLSELNVNSDENVSGQMKFVKAKKRISGNLDKPEGSFVMKKKKVKGPRFEASSDDRKKHQYLVQGKIGTVVGNNLKKGKQSASATKDHSLANIKRENIKSSSPITNSTVAFEVPQLLDDLQALALNPFYGAEKNIPGVVRQFFLRFRSLIYQKSLVLYPPSDVEAAVEEQSLKPASISGPSSILISGTARDAKPLKPAKSLLRPEDPSTKVGRKRPPLDPREEIAAKKLKKANQLKALGAVEKKTGVKNTESSKTEAREQPNVAATFVKSIKPFKKLDTSISKAVEPTMLVMKFPPGTSLPSAAQLKARFGRFGSLDQSAIRVFWKSSTCRVVFLHKSDAQSAYRYALGNNTLFGDVSVKYHLREVETPGSEGSEPSKAKGEDSAGDSLRAKELPSPIISHQGIAQPPIQLKSCLKKPSDETGQGSSGMRGTARVKFMLTGEETPRTKTEQVTNGNRNSFDNKVNSVNFTKPGGSSSVGNEFVSKNCQKVNAVSSQSAKPSPVNNRKFPSVGSCSVAAPSSASGVDISQPMLSLLTSCNDVVTHVTGMLGYVPYHPL